MPSAYTFPTLVGHNNAPDSSKYKVSLEDPSMSSDSEGGYKFTRARHTRPPRQTWDVAYTGISNTNYATLKAFYKTVRGGAASFYWTEPDTGVVFEVRFIGELSFEYAGMGNTKLWNCSFQVEEL